MEIKKYKGVFITFVIIILFLTITWIIIKTKSSDRDSQLLQRAYNLPTASEVFRLRSECAALGQKILDNNLIGNALTQSQVSHYNPTINRCFIEMTVQSGDLSGDDFSEYLYDGQTGGMLAWTRKDKLAHIAGMGGVFSGPEKISKSGSSPTSFDFANDYINELMLDDWKQ